MADEERELKISINLEYCPANDPKPYRVLRAVNTTLPTVTSYLSEDEVNAFIAAGVQVVIVPRKF
jgi:hypothetical protein